MCPSRLPARLSENCYIFAKGDLCRVAPNNRRCFVWRLFSVVALCGMPALWADVCGGLPAGPPQRLGYVEALRIALLSVVRKSPADQRSALWFVPCGSSMRMGGRSSILTRAILT
jgi:hypothetical protein